MWRKGRCILFAVLSLAVICFIFHNSFQSAEISEDRSSYVMTNLAPVLNPVGAIRENVFHKIVRKLAHFAEFFALGLCLSGWSINRKEHKRWWLPAGAAAVLVACADETIRRFTGRHCALRDVLIDCGGALFGLMAVGVLCWMAGRKKDAGGAGICPN